MKRTGLIARVVLLSGIASTMIAGTARGQTRDLAITPQVPPSQMVIGDSLLRSGDAAAAYASYASGGGVTSRWRALQVAVKLSLLAPTHEERRSWSTAADHHARALVQARPNDPDVLAWAAAAIGRRAANGDGIRSRATLVKEAWALTEQVIAVNPDHPLANYVRGEIVHAAAALPGMVRLFLRVFLGLPQMREASWEKAEEYHLRAVSEDPGAVPFYLDLGQTLADAGDDLAAMEAWKRGLGVRERDPLDAQFKERIRQRLDSLEGSGHPSP